VSATLTFWAVIVAVGALNYLSRLSFIALFARVRMPSSVARALRYVPAAMLTAIVVPAVALPGTADADALLTQARLAAALLAALVAWRTRSTTATIVAGMIALWLAQWLGRAVA
jgi:branched-subunit amino acid transport protein